MKSKTIIGYIISLIGIGLIVLSIDQVEKYLGLQLSTYITMWHLIIIGGLLVIVGILLTLKKRTPKTKQIAEVPIYQGNNIVGYRRG